MRQLIMVPMLHSPEIMQEGKSAIGEHTAQALSQIPGIDATSKRFWMIVDDRLSGLAVVKPRLYFESNRLRPMNVDPGVFKPSENMLAVPEGRVIAKFLQRVGGTVETTEDPTLLEEAGQIVRDMGNAFNSLQLDSLFTLKDRLKENGGRRDTFIAGKINGTLADGETGLLFIGGNHDIDSRLADDIQVEFLDERLKEIGREIYAEKDIGQHGGPGPEQR